MYGSVPRNSPGAGQRVPHRRLLRLRRPPPAAAGPAWPGRSRAASRAAPRSSPTSITFAGFRSRWTMPRPCATARASPICAPTSSTCPSGSGPVRRRSASVRPSTYSITRKCSGPPGASGCDGCTGVSHPMSCRTQMFGMLERRRRARFVFEPAAAVGIGGRERRQDLDGDGTAQAGVAGLVDLAHPAGPDRSLDLVGAEPEAGRQRHGSPPGAEWPVPRGRTASNDSERRAASPIILGPRGND